MVWLQRTFPKFMMKVTAKTYGLVLLQAQFQKIVCREKPAVGDVVIVLAEQLEETELVAQREVLKSKTKLLFIR